MSNKTYDTGQALSIASRWLFDFVCQPNEQVGRPGPVCPFVEPAMQAQTVHLEALHGLAEATEDTIDQLIIDMVAAFRRIDWPHRNPMMHALIYVLSDLPEHSLELLDKCQQTAKPTLADQGLMLGQFHPRCDEPAARNPEFLVARSPVPMLAMRNMALHDILFLGENSHCFQAYDKRFRHIYEKHAAVSPLFRGLYNDALQEFAAAPLSQKGWDDL